MLEDSIQMLENGILADKFHYSKMVH